VLYERKSKWMGMDVTVRQYSSDDYARIMDEEISDQVKRVPRHYAYQEQMTQALAVMDKLDPVSQGAATVNSTGIDMSKVKRVFYVLQVGAVGGGPGTVNAKLNSSNTSGFSVNQDVTGGAITQISTANQIATLEVRGDQLVQQVATARYVRVVLTVGVNAVLIALVGYGSESEQRPASQYNITAVAQGLVISI